jgi:hypothetical protein
MQEDSIHVATPVKMRIPTRVQVEMTPRAEEKERNLSGMKEVGMTLPKASQRTFSKPEHIPHTASPTTFH